MKYDLDKSVLERGLLTDANNLTSQQQHGENIVKITT